MNDKNDNSKLKDEDKRTKRTVVIQIGGKSKSGRGSGKGYLWRLLGGVACCVLPMFGPLMVTYGVMTAAFNRGEKQRATAALFTLAPILLYGARLGSLGVSLALLLAATGFAVAGSKMQNKLTVSRGILYIIAIALVGFGLYYFTGGSNQSITESFVHATLVELREMGVQVSADVQKLILEQVSLYWPQAFVLTAAEIYLSALAGAYFATKTLGSPLISKPFAEYDNPLWIVVILILGIAASAAGPHIPQYGTYVRFIGDNIAFSARMLFAVQGLSVVIWAFRNFKVPLFFQILLLFFSLILEAAFMFLSVVGVVDVWANFRKLKRNDG
ncbi:MAG: DUF2232 domain-containing protein [Rhodoferax sp.]